MNLLTATVTDKNGEVTASTKGKTVRYDDRDPYAFCIQNPNSSSPKTRKVLIVMPLGGGGNGIFRYPKVGEQVLVAGDTDDYYLLGYVPNTTDQRFNVSKALPRDEQGERGADGQDGGYIVRFEEGGDRSDLRMGKTIQILSNLSTNFEGADEGARYGDRDGDELVDGGVNIRAGKRIVIRAGEEIELRVGRSAIRLKDGDITLVTTKTNRPLKSPWDSSISLTPDYTALSGAQIKAGAGYGFTITTALGDSIRAFGGILSISARSISLAVQSTLNYIASILTFGTNLITNNLISLKNPNQSMWRKDRDSFKLESIVMDKLISPLWKLVITDIAAPKWKGSAWDQKLLQITTLCTDLINFACDQVAAWSELDHKYDKNAFMIAKECMVITEVLIPMFSLLATSTGVEFLFGASLKLTPNAAIAMTAYSVDIQGSKDHTVAIAPLAALQDRIGGLESANQAATPSTAADSNE